MHAEMSKPVLISETFLDSSMWKRQLWSIYVRYKHLFVAPPSWYPCNGSRDEGWSQGHTGKFWQGCSTVGGGRAKARRAQCHVQAVPGVKSDLAIKMLGAQWCSIVGWLWKCTVVCKSRIMTAEVSKYQKDMFATSPTPTPSHQLFDGRNYTTPPLRTLQSWVNCIYNGFFQSSHLKAFCALIIISVNIKTP